MSAEAESWSALQFPILLGAAFQIGFNLLSPDVRGGSPHPLLLMVNLGVQYALTR